MLSLLQDSSCPRQHVKPVTGRSSVDAGMLLTVQQASLPERPSSLAVLSRVTHAEQGHVQGPQQAMQLRVRPPSLYSLWHPQESEAPLNVRASKLCGSEVGTWQYSAICLTHCQLAGTWRGAGYDCPFSPSVWQNARLTLGARQCASAQVGNAIGGQQARSAQFTVQLQSA